jgi:hypothetical protein
VVDLANDYLELATAAGDKIKVRLAPGGGFAANLHLIFL